MSAALAVDASEASSTPDVAETAFTIGDAKRCVRRARTIRAVVGRFGKRNLFFSVTKAAVVAAINDLLLPDDAEFPFHITTSGDYLFFWEPLVP